MDTIDKYILMIPAAPLLAAILCGVIGPWLSKRVPKVTAWITVAALGSSCFASFMLFGEISSQQDPHAAPFSRVIEIWTWANVDEAMLLAPTMHDFRVAVTLRADALTSMMLCMVTFVSTLVAVYSMGYMNGDRSYWRFFAYVSLFVFSMTMLVSVSNFVLLFVFWEAVGVCSYLLIGFWYTKPEAAAAGMKAFLVNRVGDIGFALALFLIWTTYGSLNFHDSLVTETAGETGVEKTVVPIDSNNDQDVNLSSDTLQGVLSRHPSQYKTGTVALVICLLLLLGACGKSAQFPLHIWLPDAMEGPTPVSALIHAATMVTAGIYMVTRCSPLFMASPDAQLVVACVGGFTALLGGLIALTQFDLKRVLAYSTISQLGYMFLGLGVGSFAGISAGMYHLFTHAFFKALLFLGAGSVMHAMGHVIDMRRFGGLRKIMPITHATFLLGCLALSGLFPFSGFWSKDAIIGSIHEKAHQLQHIDHGGHGVADGSATVTKSEAVYSLPIEVVSSVYYSLYYLALFTAFLTAVYTFRAYFMTFHGELRTPPEAGEHAHESPPSMTAPLVVLAVFATLIGMLIAPLSSFAGFIGMTPSLSSLYVGSHAIEFHMDVAMTSIVIVLIGMSLAAYLYLGGTRQANALARLFNAPWYQRMFDVNAMARLQNKSWIQKTIRRAEGLGLGWLAVLTGRFLLLIGLVVSAPLILLGFASPYRLSQKKFFFDELYQFSVVKPLKIAATFLYAIDRIYVDGLVNLVGRLPVLLGSLLRPLQMGLTPFYALSMVLGTLVLILVRLLWLPS